MPRTSETKTYRLPVETVAQLEALARHYGPGTSLNRALVIAVQAEARRVLGADVPTTPLRNRGRPKGANKG